MRLLISALCAFTFSSAIQAQTNPAVRFRTTLGDIDVVLLADTAPLTVANFFNYLNKGEYTNTIFHRSVPGFIIQGGGYQLINHQPTASAQDPAVKNEFGVSNTRGTVAMAKLGTDANSATNQWFFNLANNASNLDNQNGGFTVFGRVANSASLSVMDRIAALPVYNLGSPFDQIPLYGITANSTSVADSNFVLVGSILRVPSLSSAGFQSAADYASSSSTGISPGEILTLFGSSLGPTDLVTLILDSNGVVTNSLGGTRVLFDGTPGAMIYTSSGQLSVVAPYNLAGKTTTRVIVEYQGIQTAATQVNVTTANPGIFTLDSSGKGDAAVVQLNGSVVSSTSPAAPGDTLLLFAEGHGATSPQLSDGAIVGSNLPVPVANTTLLIDGKAVPTLYIGGAPTLINGVLQINFTVPPLAPGPHSVQIQAGTRLSPAGVNLQTR